MVTDKKVIHMSRTTGREEVMITLDDDFILDDIKPDIRAKIKERGDVIIEKVKGMEGRVGISGRLKYQLLYSTGNSCECMEGEIPFEEVVAIAGVTAQELVKCMGFLEDISIHVIHSRKISVKALIKLNISTKSMYGSETVLRMDMENLQTRYRRINAMRLVAAQKDIFRIRETITLPAANDSAGKILWYELEPESMEFRMRDNELMIKGELSVFCIYTSEQMESNINFHTENIPFTGKISLNDSIENAYPDICVSISEKNLNIHADNNGEMRMLDAEVIIDMDIKAYGEENCEVLADAYSPSRELVFSKEKVMCESVVMKNNVQCKVEKRFKLPETDVVKILNSTGVVYIEDIVNSEESAMIEGSVTVDVLCLRNDPEEMIKFMRYKLPFSQKISDMEYNEKFIYTCKTEGLRVNTNFANNEVDVKCVMGIDVMVTSPCEETLITDVAEGKPDYERLKKLPGITGYITGSEDTLWDIAKKYGTTVNKIMELNNLNSEEIRSGMKLLIVKSC